MTTESVTRTNTIPQFSELAHQIREQIVTGVKAHHQATLEAVESFTQATAKAGESFPTLDSSKALPDLSALTADGFDLAQELLAAQRGFSLQLVSAFAPAKSA